MSERKPLRIILPGGSGHLGNLVAQHFRAHGDQVVVLSRKIIEKPWRVVRWDGATVGPWASELENADVIINLAGRSVDCRYNKKNRQEILDSRINSTRVIGEAIAHLAHPPRLWMNMSTATIYRHSLDRSMDELTGEIGGSERGIPPTWYFSHEVATRWEQEFFAAMAPRTRRIALRSAMVMSPAPRGIFAALLCLVRFGFGGTAASGRQYVSWIHAQDFVHALEFLMAHGELHGAINIASPHPLPNQEFMAQLRAAWGTRFGLNSTKRMLALGALFLRTETELILKSRRVVPARLLAAGFSLAYPDWNMAARQLVEQWLQGPLLPQISIPQIALEGKS